MSLCMRHGALFCFILCSISPHWATRFSTSPRRLSMSQFSATVLMIMPKPLGRISFATVRRRARSSSLAMRFETPVSCPPGISTM